MRIAVAEKILHLRRAKKQQGVLTLCQEKEKVGAIVFDYMQNFPLSKIPVQEVFCFVSV